jgi:hypothetical protein
MNFVIKNYVKWKKTLNFINIKKKIILFVWLYILQNFTEKRINEKI